MKGSYFLLSACCLFSCIYADVFPPTESSSDIQENVVFVADDSSKMDVVNAGAVENLNGLPTDSELRNLAGSLLTLFQDGFQIGDLVSIFEKANTYLEEHYTLSVQQKRNALVKVICIIIDETDTPYVPDFVFDPLFKLLVPPVVALMYPDAKEISASGQLQGSPSEQDVLNAVNGFFDQLKDGFTLQDIPKCFYYVVNFSSHYFELTIEEKASIAKQMLSQILDQTDTPYLPDFIFDELFKMFGNSMIDFLVINKVIQ